ncbi:MAG: ABC transporter permease [Rikenellaceae bacterium]
MKYIWRLLFRHISIGQFLGFALANLLGMTILLLGVQFYSDSSSLLNSGDSFFRPDYMVVSKPVSAVEILGTKGRTFSDEDISELLSQPFIRSVGAFTPSMFRVRAGLELPDKGSSIYTDLFFESVPDKYVDIDLKDWHYTDGDEMIPIVIPRNYLNLYNFGFASSRNMPKVTEELISLVEMSIQIGEGAEAERFRGRVVGFSDRLNTILVPESFQRWANANFASEVSLEPSRLIVEVENPADERIAIYFEANELQSENDKLDSGKATYFLRLVIVIVLIIGFVISALSLYILLLSIFLLLTKNSHKLETLILVGYSTRRVALPYQIFSVSVCAVVIALAYFIVDISRGGYLEIIETLSPGVFRGDMTLCFIMAAFLLAFTSLLNCWVVRRKISALMYMHRTKKKR